MTGTLPFDVPASHALLSDCGRYRYSLTRQWRFTPDPRPATFVMLNPSTADALVDDPTITRCIGFAKAWGLDGITVVNLYAYRSTDPDGLWRVDDPVGPDNDLAIQTAVREAARRDAPIVAAWGVNARPDRVEHVLTFPGMDRLTALGETARGAPRHPLYMPSASPLTPWPSRD
jgi:hypothetical protein